MVWLVRLGALLPILFCCSVALADSERIKVVAILSRDTKPYHEVVQGIRQVFSERKLDVALDVHIIDTRTDNTDVKAATLAANPEAILSLGSLATEFTLNELPGFPLCAGLIVDPSVLGRHAKATALVLKFPLEIELQWLRRFIGTDKTIAVLYDERKNAEKIKYFQQIARREGVNVHAQPVSGPAELPDALRRLPQHIAALWSFADAGLLNAQSAKHVLLYSFRNRVPLVGLSNSWTKAGALYSLDRDYLDIGRQCGEKIIQILQGTPPEVIPVESPRRVLYSINLKALRHMKLDIPEQLIREAHETF